MIIVIDGYNLLKHLFPGAKQNLDKQKNSLIQQLAYYKKSKGGDIKEITLVFDAGPSNHATRSIKSGIITVYAGTRSSADDWILQFVQRSKGKDVLVITLDRALRESCVALGADWLDVYNFHSILQQHLLSDAEALIAQTDYDNSALQKYEPIDLDEIHKSKISNTALDLLMEQAAAQPLGKKNTDSLNQASPRTKKSYTLSKKEKRIQGKLKKLQ